MNTNISNQNIFNTNKYVIEILKQLPETDEINYKIGELLEMSRLGFEINSLDTRFKLRVNVKYYLYEKRNSFILHTKYLSLISPDEWHNNKDKFRGCYRLNENFIWIKEIFNY